MNNLRKMIMENSFSKREIPRILSCTICRKLLNDACKGPCNCLFCWTCIKEYLKNGQMFCPTNNNSCKIDKLSLNQNVIRDPEINKMVLELNVICPFSGCSYENELQKMSDHLRICKERNYCPYYEMGCCIKFNKFEDISNHLQNDNYNHVNLMIGWMTNMKNEFQRVENLNMISILNTTKDQMEQYSENQRQNEITNDNVSNIIEITRNIDIEIKSKREDLINLKSDLEIFKKEYYKFKSQSEKKVEKLNRTIQNLQNEIELLKVKSNNREQEIPIKIWKISSFKEKLMRNETILSDRFDCRKNGHKLALSLIPDTPKGFISVYIRHYNSESNNTQNISFSGLLEIRISNEFSPKKHKICQKFCEIPPYDRSEPFKFKHQELISIGIFGDQMIIECFIFN